MKESVTAILTQSINGEDKIFVIYRQENLRAFPGYLGFPGGKVDKEDSEPERAISHELVSVYEPHLITALQRELIEELGFDLKKAMDQDFVIGIDHLGISITPNFNPYRFHNHYFRIQLAPGIPFERDENAVDGKKEIAYCGFYTPTELMAEYNQAEILTVPPTIILLEALKKDIFTKEQLNYTLNYDEKFEVPMIESVKGVKQFLPLSNTFPPANRTNCFLIGDEHKVLIDPSPKDEEEYKKLNYSVGKIGFQEIFLTHHHPDHVEFSTTMARFHQVPIGMSKDTHQRLLKKNGESWFEDVEIKFYKDGDILTTSLGSEVKVIETPGHDEGQLSLAPKSLNWCIVGDLIQTVGTVVIGGDEGDMAKYFASLQKIIDLDPQFIYPSHGIALGGVWKLKETLKHRQMREEQVKELLEQGKGREEMLLAIYPDLEERLHKYALATIDAHLKKIQS